MRTPEGREWLESDEGVQWINSAEGLAWADTSDGKEWLDELAQRGWEDHFSGKLPDAPEGWFTPDTAPLIGTRVRFRKSFTTIGGTHFKKSELAIVSEMTLAPMGTVWLVLRTLDGRTMRTAGADEFDPA